MAASSMSVLLRATRAAMAVRMRGSAPSVSDRKVGAIAGGLAIGSTAATVSNRLALKALKRGRAFMVC